MPEEHVAKPTEGVMAGAPPVLAPAHEAQTTPVTAPRTAPQTTSIQPPAPPASKGPGPGDMKDGTREVIETVVFVVVLVLLLKTFLAEAFVIPTGSMATTLLGYHLDVTCDMCGYHFLVNASAETEENFRNREDRFPPPQVTQCYCPNCRHVNVLRRPAPKGEAP